MSEKLNTQRTITRVALHDHLETWIEAFLVDRKAQNLSDGTITFYRKKLSLLTQFADTQLITQVSQLEPDVIRRWLMWLEQGAHNPGGIHACYRTLRAFVRWYWQETDQEGNPPTAKVKAPRVDLEPLVPVELEQVQSLLKTCDKTLTGLRDKAIFMVLLDTGMRAGEVHDHLAVGPGIVRRCGHCPEVGPPLG